MLTFGHPIKIVFYSYGLIYANDNSALVNVT